MSDQWDNHQEVNPGHHAGLVAGDLILDSALKSRDADKFGHSEIAEIVAELAGHVEMPVNIALFGPWGSGKSSLFELIKTELEHRNGVDGFPVVKAISYDAWKFSGTPLKRTFITNAATQLGFNKAKYRSDLYENRSSIQLPIRELWQRRRHILERAGAVAVLFIIIVFLAGVLWASADTLTHRNPSVHVMWDALANRIKSLLRWASIAFVPFVGGLSLLDFARVTVTRSAPREDEEFHDAFVDMMDQALSPPTETWGERRRRKREDRPLRPTWERILVFVDELDRCSPDDVLETLVGIKTFLEHPSCVFVVAADRDVLVEALNKSPGDKARQATPVRQHEPYYSTAGAFLDKMFQHQLELPTLRRHKLAVFAKQLIEEQKQGIWKEFSSTEIEDIVYTLIPLHVRSPRRVKVLLNAFATTARIADARDVEWRDNPAKLAKLVVLRTEFPVFANDLHLEPKLVNHLEDRRPPGDEAPPRLSDLYANYTLGTDLEADSPAPDADASGEPVRNADSIPDVTPASQLVGHDTDDEQIRRTQVTINMHLLDYLEKTKFSNVSGPSRTLLHLEAAGQKEGLQDQGLADVLDDAADRDPDRTLELFQHATDVDRSLAARILGSQIDEQVGAGKRSVVETVCRLVEELDQDAIEEVAPAIAPEIMRAVGSRLGTAAMIPGALALGAARGDASALDALLDRYETLLNTDSGNDLRLAAVADQLERLPQSQRERAAQMVTDSMAHGRDEGVVRVLGTASPTDLKKYWDDNGQAIREHLTSRLTSASQAGEPLDPAATFDIILRPLVVRDEVDGTIVADALWEVLLGGEEYYPYVLERSRERLPIEGAEEVESGLAIEAIGAAPITDVPYWLGLVNTAEAGGDQVTAALSNVIGDADPANPDHLKILDQVVSALAVLLSDDDRESVAEQVIQDFEAMLGAFGFGQNQLQPRRSIDVTLRRIARAEHDRYAVGQVLSALDQAYDPSTTAVIVEYINADTSDTAATQVLAELRNRHGDSPQTPQAFRALAAAQVRAGDVRAIPAAVFNQLRSTHNDPLLAKAWLATIPPVNEVIALYQSGFRFSVPPIRNYAILLSQADRTELWLQLASLTTPLVQTLTAVAAAGVDLTRIEPIFDSALTAKTDGARKSAAGLLVTLPLGNGQLLDRSTSLVEALLNTDVKGNVSIAADIAIAANGAKDGHKRDIRKLFNAKVKDLTSRRQHVALADAGLVNMPTLEKARRLLGGK